MVTAGIYGLLETLWWNIKGQWMYYFYTHVYTHVQAMWMLPEFSPGPPQWWIDTYYYHDSWNDHINDDGKPDIIFVLLYRSAAKDRFSDWVNRAATNVATLLVDAVKNYLGLPQHGHITFSDWVDAIRNRVGTGVPWWTTTLDVGLNYLREKLPASIFSYPYTWDSIWENIKTAVKDWVRGIYDDAKTWVANTAPWLITGYNTVRGWYDAVATWVTNFKADAYGTVAGWLGVAWSTWTGIHAGILNFYNDVWVPFKVGLHDFLDHPVLWLYDRFDEEADEYIETLSRWVGKIAEKIIVWASENT